MLDFNDAPRQGPADNSRRIEALREALRRSAPALVRELFPAARFQGNEARIGSAAGEPGESMSIVLSGDKAGQWFDHNPTSTQRQGDLISLWQMGVGGDFMQAVEDLELHLGLRSGPKWTGRVARVASERQKAAPAEAVTKTLETAHTYLAADGQGVLGTVLRYRLSNGKKTFSQRNADGENKAPPDPKPLYNQHLIAQNDVVVLVEGEKCADALVAEFGEGMAATTAMGGSGMAVDRIDWSPLRGKRVVLWPDNDEAGRTFMAKVEAHLRAMGIACAQVKVPANRPEKWDAADCLAEGYTEAAAGLLGAALAIMTPEAPKAAPDRSLRFVSIADLATMEPPRWLVQGLIPENSFSVVVGPPASLKTFVALDWALSITTGRQWQEKEMGQGPVVYVAGEGQHGLANRVLGWLDHKGLPPEAPLHIVPQGVAMPTGQLDELLALIATLPEPPVMVVLDTLARTFGAGDENSQKDMNAYVAACDRLKAETGATVLVIHHTGKDVDRGARGSSALTGAADVVVAVRRDGETVTLINSGPAGKQKDADEHPDILLRRVVHRFERRHGEASTIVLLKQEPIISEDQPPTSAPQGRPDGEPTKADRLLAMLQDAETRGLPGLGLTAVAAALFGGDKANASKCFATLVKRGQAEECEGAFPKLWRAI